MFRSGRQVGIIFLLITNLSDLLFTQKLYLGYYMFIVFLINHVLHFCGIVWLLCEDSEYELALLVRGEGGGDDGVVARGQPEPARNLPQVHKRLAPGNAGGGQTLVSTIDDTPE